MIRGRARPACVCTVRLPRARLGDEPRAKGWGWGWRLAATASTALPLSDQRDRPSMWVIAGLCPWHLWVPFWVGSMWWVL